MKYFAVQIHTTKENLYIDSILKKLTHRTDRQRFIFPKRRLQIRKAGKNSFVMEPLFPGYIFLEIETDSLDNELYNIMRKTPHFFRFLPNNQDIHSLEGRDLTILSHFLQFGEVADLSQVYFDENDRIVVKTGPLQGLEGQIIRVDRRKQRAKVRLDFSEHSFTMDLGFEVINRANQENAK
jgi:transcriptional antiterminator NusG